MGRASQKWKSLHVPLGDECKALPVGFTPGKACPGTCCAPVQHFPPSPKARLQCSRFGSRREVKRVCARYLGEAKGCQAQGQVEKGLFGPCWSAGLPREPGCASPPAQLWVNSHPWAFLHNHLAMADSTLEAELVHFFCLSRLPPPPHTLDAGRQCLPLPATLPCLCPCSRRSRAQGLGGFFLPVAVDGCCPCTGAGCAAACCKHSLTSGWREGARLASSQVMGAFPSCERQGAGAWHVAVHTGHGYRVSPCHRCCRIVVPWSPGTSGRPWGPQV